MSDTTEATCCGRLFRASDNRLTYSPFSELDFIILEGAIMALAVDRDELVIDTNIGRYRLRYVGGTPEDDWTIVLEAKR